MTALATFKDFGRFGHMCMRICDVSFCFHLPRLKLWPALTSDVNSLRSCALVVLKQVHVHARIDQRHTRLTPLQNRGSGGVCRPNHAQMRPSGSILWQGTRISSGRHTRRFPALQHTTDPTTAHMSNGPPQLSSCHLPSDTQGAPRLVTPKKASGSRFRK